MKFQDRLKLLCTSRGKTITSIADDMGVATPTLSRYINGKHEPDYGTLRKIAIYFNVSMDWLGGLTDVPNETIISKEPDINRLYSIASNEDKKIIDLVLSKYKDAL